jgi:hypothetical protein
MLSTTKASTLMSASRCSVSVIGFVGSEDHASVGTDCLADQIVLI